MGCIKSRLKSGGTLQIEVDETAVPYAGKLEGLTIGDIVTVQGLVHPECERYLIYYTIALKNKNASFHCTWFWFIDNHFKTTFLLQEYCQASLAFKIDIHFSKTHFFCWVAYFYLSTSVITSFKYWFSYYNIYGKNSVNNQYLIFLVIFENRSTLLFKYIFFVQRYV